MIKNIINKLIEFMCKWCIHSKYLLDAFYSSSNNDKNYIDVTLLCKRCGLPKDYPNVPVKKFEEYILNKNMRKDIIDPDIDKNKITNESILSSMQGDIDVAQKYCYAKLTYAIDMSDFDYFYHKNISNENTTEFKLKCKKIKEYIDFIKNKYLVLYYFQIPDNKNNDYIDIETAYYYNDRYVINRCYKNINLNNLSIYLHDIVKHTHDKCINSYLSNPITTDKGMFQSRFDSDIEEAQKTSTSKLLYNLIPLVKFNKFYKKEQKNAKRNIEKRDTKSQEK